MKHNSDPLEENCCSNMKPTQHCKLLESMQLINAAKPSELDFNVFPLDFPEKVSLVSFQRFKPLPTSLLKHLSIPRASSLFSQKTALLN